MKKTGLIQKVAVFIAVSMLFIIFTACSGKQDGNIQPIQTPTEPPIIEKDISFFADKKFEKGFGVMGISGETGRTNMGYFTYGGSVSQENSVWQIGQWGGKSDLSKATEKKISDGSWEYNAGGKYLVVNPLTGKLILGVDGSMEYDHPRKGGEGWAHNLLEQHFESAQNVENCESVFAKMKFKIDLCERLMTEEEYNPNLHRAHLLWYITFSNIPPKDNPVDKATGIPIYGYPGDYLWFGVPLYDSELISQKESFGYDAGTAHYIYGLDNSLYLNVPIEKGEVNEFSFDILPYLKNGVKKTQEMGGLPNVKYENLYITYMNMGFEVPGTYAIQATFDYIDITYIPKTSLIN